MPRLSRVTLAVALPLMLITLLLAGCASSSTPPAKGANGKPLDTVTLALDWTPNTNHTGIYAAIANGWYRAQGIDLRLTPYSSSIAPETLVATNKADFAISFTESVTAARAVGQPPGSRPDRTPCSR